MCRQFNAPIIYLPLQCKLSFGFNLPCNDLPQVTLAARHRPPNKKDLSNGCVHGRLLFQHFAL